MEEKISALFDGQLDDDEAARLFASSADNVALRQGCRSYQLIGDALRGEAAFGADITDTVMMRLLEEPTVLAPKPRRAWQRPTLALAASLSGVAVVGWLAMQQSHEVAVPTVAQNTPAAVRTVAAHDMQEYVIAHQAQSANMQFQGGTEHIRTVALGFGK